MRVEVLELLRATKERPAHAWVDIVDEESGQVLTVRVDGDAMQTPFVRTETKEERYG
jgi:hypothetical protein